ncbi:DUF6802 family protein [Pseudonocardia sp. ICBG1142]|uniref:DUF6802 family protein n=1 Tax=Pseudonocardia sp. ICBG1142 TaxID=2846760 RepID=UPI001CF65EC0|nr:DUF6802 family protein [Pseudonocardia sp. ICBG1142]
MRTEPPVPVGNAVRVGSRVSVGSTAPIGSAVPVGSTVLAGAVVAAALPVPWWVRVPRARPGVAGSVPVSGPAARDGDGDGVAETLVVETERGPEFWTDLDGDGLADVVTGLPGSPG